MTTEILSASSPEPKFGATSSPINPGLAVEPSTSWGWDLWSFPRLTRGDESPQPTGIWPSLWRRLFSPRQRNRSHKEPSFQQPWRWFVADDALPGPGCSKPLNSDHLATGAGRDEQSLHPTETLPLRQEHQNKKNHSRNDGTRWCRLQDYKGRPTWTDNSGNQPNTQNPTKKTAHWIW